MQEHIVAVFDSDTSAAEAARELQQAGIPASSIRQYRRDGEIEQRQETQDSGGGFWSWLLGEEGGTADLPRHHRSYDRSVDSGRAVLAVTIADDTQIHRAIELIDAHHPVEINEETEEGDEASSTAGLTTGAGTQTGAWASGNTRTAATSTSGSAGVRSTGSVADTAQGRREETIPLAEEELEVGKRVVDHGTTRIRRYVVETPVEREVTLHGERVSVERRRPVAGTEAPGTAAFEERTVEVHESEEVPVVRKNAHVAEEVVVRREETERQEKVRDTVRREDVEITGDGKRSPKSR